MIVLIFTPAVLSCLLAAAHFYRAGLLPLAIGSLLCPFLFCITKPFSIRYMQLALILFSLEWIRTAFMLVQMRIELGMDWIRLSSIIGTVALFTAGSALLLQLSRVRERYNSL